MKPVNPDGKSKNVTYLPAMIAVDGNGILIFGGGKVAYRKAKQLAKENIKITAVSKEFTAQFYKLKDVTLRRMDLYRLNSYSFRHQVSFIATDDSSLNERLSVLCREAGVIYNRVDNLDSSFISPAWKRVGSITVAVSTSGKSPTFAAYLCKKLVRSVGRKDLRTVERLSKMREQYRGIPYSRKKKIMKEALKSMEAGKR